MLTWTVPFAFFKRVGVVNFPHCNMRNRILPTLWFLREVRWYVYIFEGSWIRSPRWGFKMATLDDPPPTVWGLHVYQCRNLSV